MKTNGQLSLHEAIVVALINLDKTNFTATFAEIADYIDARGLFNHEDNKVSLTQQVKLRSTLSKGKYKYLFSKVDNNKIQLKPSS